MTKDFNATIARIAGNIASGMMNGNGEVVNLKEERWVKHIAAISVVLARAIMAETLRTEEATDAKP